MGFDVHVAGATAVVTGASSGIGAEYARRLAELGWNLTLVARRGQRLEALAEQLRESAGVAVETLSADLAHDVDLARVAERVGRDDVALLVNNAGINGYGPFDETDPELLQRVLSVNVTAPTVLARAALPGMRARGRGAIVNVASLLAFAGSMAPGPLPQRVTYAGTKGYLVTFTRTLAAELGPDTDVTVQVLCPGLTATEFHFTTGLESVAAEAEQRGEHGMPAEDVVLASVSALGTGEVVCVPGLDDPATLEQLTAAEHAIRSGSDPAKAASRYRGA
ncbi:SDR family NAD(P)-dependent oxidoreductase [Amycolatopsis acidiphila]|uniref:SDR family NAD(P)-dependent oxidoreductase n=1 Tax=Amycolatopsis acidiphila TaxID=715473 RepID=A0A558ADC2_9PSEU|nr:SDR family NAD(P)-dependent oxidoreductase [Amycolatopsis acidiphila]TVT22261.1 SDR family NAD(P)-dependent oxidoreductase [Amycolatopsis acidiphila]UIJ58028.1 SDR family NAD(P)-dependent oxidoreductase [Amycolatopsis acidiphila]GHG70512.1 SDR family oxidoreductase [Amycolatopsis acidiphila]